MNDVGGNTSWRARGARAAVLFAGAFVALFTVLPPINDDPRGVVLLLGASVGAGSVAAVGDLWGEDHQVLGFLALIPVVAVVVLWAVTAAVAPDETSSSTTATTEKPTTTTTATTVAVDPRRAPGTGLVSYDVDAEPDASVPIVVRHTGYVTQQFVAASERITWVGVIVGCDPALTPSCGPDGSFFGQLDVQILDDEGVIGRAKIDTVNNDMSEGPLDPIATGLVPGTTYVMRVVNLTDVSIGFLHSQDSDPTLETVVSGALRSGDDGPNGLDLAGLVEDR